MLQYCESGELYCYNMRNNTDTEMLEVAHALKNTHKVIAID